MDSPSQIREEVEVTIDLRSRLGAGFRPDGAIDNIKPGGQLDRINYYNFIGLHPGDRITTAGGTSIWNLDQLKSVMQQHKNRGEQSLTLTFRKVRVLEPYNLGLQCPPCH